MVGQTGVAIGPKKSFNINWIGAITKTYLFLNFMVFHFFSR